jgi:transcription-repair coupling factor (superfamily II helicase)
MTAAPTPAKPRSLPWKINGVPGGSEALVLSELLNERLKLASGSQTVVHIAVNDRSLDMMATCLAFFAPEAQVLTFPAWDCMPYDRTSPLAGIMAQRVRVLSQLASVPHSTGKRIVLTTANAILQKLPPRDAMRDVAFNIRKGVSLNRDKLVAFLLSQGYQRTGKAMEPGEFAVRGSILDIVPSGMSEGTRIDMFGDDIESIRSYDLLSQLTLGAIEQVELYPVSEVFLNDKTVQQFRERYRELFGAVSKDDPLYEAISEKRNYVGMEHWLPLFYENMETLFDYCPDALVTMDHEAQVAMEERQESILDYYEARVSALKNNSAKNSFAAGSIYNPVPPDAGFITLAAWKALQADMQTAIFSPFVDTGNNPNSIAVGYRPAIRFTQNQPDRTPFDQLRDTIESASAKSKSVLIACFSQGSRERLQTLLMERGKEHGFHCIKLDSWKENRNVRGKSIGLLVLPLENGFETANHLILSEQDMLGERIARAKPRKKKSDVFMAESAMFGEGELVVHKEHGIGRFEGLVTLTVSGAAHDCLKIIYEGDDKLFLPVENIDMVSRFGMEEDGVKLDKLGGVSWQSRKAKLKQRIKLAAEALLKTAAERLIRKGTVLETPTGTYDDFCARFPYVETEDQARAILDVLEDLHSGRPMDRLICGDVGFGKTEVALRAAFVASCSLEHKLQVAVIAPTTLLARQHFRNFSARFAGFPVTVRQLSRIVSPKDQKETREMLAAGKVDIIVGTHALLSKQVQFKNLGLMIVDEEQHFGVSQKEKLKELKADIHVLTLSATPIPRTLQMALTGVRDLSLITTPPIDRLAVRSFVMPFDSVVIREAIQREMHRGGKCFVVTPRIKHIAELKTHLAELVPEAKICVAHGQMPPADLDEIMNEFYDGKYDILLSTAIIESGLDIPTANTMIIHNAHLFGLAQLYQLRGRVGRGKIRAYAYFLLPHRKELTKNATRRLEVMQTLDTLGAGFTLASHDMDIRGFGNLVGEEQSGHIREVGIELYQQMLEEAVAALKAGKKDALDENLPETNEWSPQINLGLSVLIPESYVSDLGLRLGLYRRVTDLNTEEEIDSFAAELVDRFGAMPEEVSHLISVLGIKLPCRKAGIERIDTGPKGAVLSFRDNRFAKPEALLNYVERNVRYLKARPDNKIVYSAEWKTDTDKIAAIRKLSADIAGLLQ